MVLALFLCVVGGVAPLLGRWLWEVLHCKQNVYQMQQWQKRFDGRFGEVSEWLMGMDRDGNLRP